MLARPHIPQLDALRFMAAFCVLAAHYAEAVLERMGVNGPWVAASHELPAIGMPLFFVLSGVVIHLNYCERVMAPGGVRQFLVARFARLYPLFLVVFVISLVAAIISHRGACGDIIGILSAAPYHLTFTQSWIYHIHCDHSLLFQYPLGEALTWSLSVEFFLYLAYVMGLRRIVYGLMLKRLVGVCLGMFAVLIGYFVLVHAQQDWVESTALNAFGEAATAQHGYADSLLRWLLYFNPLVWLVPFVWGMGIAEYYRQHGPAPFKPWQNIGTFAAVVLVVLLYYVVVLRIAPTDGSIGRISGFLLMPAIASVIGAMLFWPATRPARFMQHKLMVVLGEASYSIYLLHSLLIAAMIRALHFGDTYPWVMYVGAMLITLTVSRVSYLVYERPALRWARKLLS